jgi:uncharacterized repeat protein (TIGR02543 family)
MKKKIIIGFIAVALVAVIGLVAFRFLGKKKTIDAEIQRLVGKVYFYDKEDNPISFKEKMDLKPGTRITTGDNSLVTLILDKTKIFTVEENSNIRIEGTSKNLEIVVLEGNFYFNVAEKLAKDETFNIRIGNTVMGVRGTSAYSGTDSNGHHSLMVTDGSVYLKCENSGTGEETSVTAHPGDALTMYLDDEAEGDDTVTFKERRFREEDLPALALDAIRKDKGLQERIGEATGLSVEKIIALAEVTSIDGESMYGEAADTYKQQDAIPIMGQEAKDMVVTANAAADTAEEYFDLEIAIIEGIMDVLGSGKDNGVKGEELSALIRKSTECVCKTVKTAKDAGVKQDDLVKISRIVSDSLAVSIDKMEVAKLSSKEIDAVMDAVTEVYSGYIRTAVGADGDINSAVNNASGFITGTVSAEMAANATGDETVEALLGFRDDSRDDPGNSGDQVGMDGDDKPDKPDDDITDNTDEDGEKTGLAIRFNNVNGCGKAFASVNGTTVEKAKPGDSVTITCNPDYGYYLLELSAKASDGKEITVTRQGTFGSMLMPDGEVTVTVVFVPIEYTVTLETNGGEIKKGDVGKYTYGVGATLPTAVKKDATAETIFTFDGWYTEQTGGRKITVIGTTATGNKTYYAHWIESTREYSISYDNSGEGTVTATVNGQYVSKAAVGETVTITATPMDGYKFENWTDTKGNCSIDASLTESIVSFTMPAGDVNLTVVFSPIMRATYSVTLDTVGGTISSGNVTSYVCGIGATLPTELTKAATAEATFTFDGWYSMKEGGEKVTAISTSETGDKTYYAHWITTLKEYAITIDAVENGTANATVNGQVVTAAAVGETLTITCTPRATYETAAVTVRCNGEEVSVSGSGNTRTFVMPAGDVEVSVSFAGVVPKLYFSGIAAGGDAYVFVRLKDGSSIADGSPIESGTEVNLIIVRKHEEYILSDLYLTGKNGSPTSGGVEWSFIGESPVSDEEHNAVIERELLTNGYVEGYYLISFEMPSEDTTVSVTRAYPLRLIGDGADLLDEVPVEEAPLTYFLTAGVEYYLRTAGNGIALTGGYRVGDEFKNIDFRYDSESGRYAFTMPAYTVNVEATIVENIGQ